MSDELDKLKEKMCGLAEEMARASGRIKLDYSHESIRHVEAILAAAHDGYIRSGSENGLQGEAFAFASYIVRVVELNMQGSVRWEVDHPRMGEASFPLYLDDNEVVFPVAWCQKRIFDGPADNIWNKYQYFVLKSEPPPKKGILKKIFGR
ncbi:MAG TPA: hypothetical protein VFZ23_14240 [Pyrinomonadaceae bacterium]